MKQKTITKPAPTKEQLKTRFAFIFHNFTAEEMANPVTKASITEAMRNIKAALANAEAK